MSSTTTPAPPYSAELTFSNWLGTGRASDNDLSSFEPKTPARIVTTPRCPAPPSKPDYYQLPGSTPASPSLMGTLSDADYANLDEVLAGVGNGAAPAIATMNFDSRQQMWIVVDMVGQITSYPRYMEAQLFAKQEVQAYMRFMYDSASSVSSYGNNNTTNLGFNATVPAVPPPVSSQLAAAASTGMAPIPNATFPAPLQPAPSTMVFRSTTTPTTPSPLGNDIFSTSSSQERRGASAQRHEKDASSKDKIPKRQRVQSNLRAGIDGRRVSKSKKGQQKGSSVRGQFLVLSSEECA